MSEPVDKTNYQKTLAQLFAHNAMREELSRIDPRNEAIGSGCLGRLSDALQESGFVTGKVAVEAPPGNLASTSTAASPIVTLNEDGINEFLGPENTDEIIESLNRVDSTGLYGAVWSSQLKTALNQTEELFELLLNSPVQDADFADTRLGKRFQVIAQMIEAREERGVSRDLFFVSLNGWDHHAELSDGLNQKLGELDGALRDLVTELKKLGVWNDVVLVQTSDFGRTLTPNTGGGSDHGWGGNSFLVGGSVKGNRIIGQYPTDLTDDGAQSLGRGRIIPAIPWDSVFNGIANWMGVSDNDKLDSVLPNRNRFNNLFSADDLFK
jgi:cullin-associated NEDD8-dissociated protein 1